MPANFKLVDYDVSSTVLIQTYTGSKHPGLCGCLVTGWNLGSVPCEEIASFHIWESIYHLIVSLPEGWAIKGLVTYTETETQIIEV